MTQPERHNKSVKQTKKEGKCTNCVMSTICTYNEKWRRQRTYKCPPSIKHLSPDEDNNLAEVDLEEMGFEQAETPADMIPVIKMEYWDGCKFIIRTDKPGYKKILCRVRVMMRSKFLGLPTEKQIEIAQSQSMLKRTEEQMSEEEYLKIKKG